MIQRVYKYRPDRYFVTRMVSTSPNTLKESPVSAELIPDAEHPFEKLHNNVIRAVSRIQAYGLCNDWDLFVTFTLDPSKYSDRLALDEFRTDLTRFIRKIREKYPGYKCDFLLVPELHKNQKGWHMHGLLRDFPADLFRLFSLKEKIPKYIRDKLNSGSLVYDFPAYREKFGFVDVEPLANRDAAVGYITKYVVKGISATGKHIEKGKHLYFVSRGLNLPELIEEKEIASTPDGPTTSGVLADLELDGMIPCFSGTIKTTIHGVERILGNTCWYEFSPDGIIPTEIY